MGENPTVGLVVPTTWEELSAAVAPEPTALRSSLSADGKTLTLPAGQRKPRTRTPGKGPKGPLGEALFDLRMVLDDVTKAIGEIEAIKAANQPKWREAELLVEPLARVGHAERTLREVGRRW